MTDLSTATDTAAREFLDNLRAMATGSYLREDDKEFWEPPYPPEVVDQATAIITRLITHGREIKSKSPDTIARLATSAELLVDDAPIHVGQAKNSSAASTIKGEVDSGPEESAGASQPDAITLALAAVITPDLRKLADLSEDYDGAILDDEELSDVLVLVGALASEAHASPATIQAHTEAVLVD